MKTLFRNSVIVGALAFAVACSTPTQSFKYQEGANANDEIQTLSSRMTEARKQGVNVQSPKNFSMAEKYLGEAREKQADGKTGPEVLQQLGYARGYFEEATRVSNEVKSNLGEVTKAREEAVAAKAPEYFRKDFKEADEKFGDLTREFEESTEKVSLKDRQELQSQYLALELRAIKQTELGEAKGFVDAAEKANAKKYAPMSLSDAKAKLSNAEAVITTDRHNKEAYKTAVMEANQSAQKLNKITAIVLNAKNMTPEAIALEINKASNQIDSTNQQLSQTSQQLNAANTDLQNKDSVISGLATRNKALAARERLDRALAEAQKIFPKDEAEAYRQGDQLLLRFKKIQFSSGRKELPESAITTLTKAKDVIAMLGAEEVKVEGHTDSVGGKALNERLSQERADAVAHYLVEEAAVKQSQISAKGYGFQKPLTSNKNNMGRAQNRRVDLLITPAGARDTGVAE